MPHGAEPRHPRHSSVDPNVVRDAWRVVDGALLHYRGEPVGTAATANPEAALNYDQCFVRDFATSAATLLMAGRHAPVRNFLRAFTELQSRDATLDCFRPGTGLMPASFGISHDGAGEALVADFGQRAIGRVAPVDAALWWLLILRAYTRATGDEALVRDPATVEAIERILNLYLPPRFEMLPSLLVPDGAFMIDRRLGVYGHPLEVQALFFGALRSARELLPADHPHQQPVLERAALLGYHVRAYYWLDADRVDAITGRQVEQYGMNAANRFDLSPDSVPGWVSQWIPEGGGYFAGNLGPARIDCRFYAGGNLLAVTTGLAPAAQASALAELLDRRSDDLLGAVPMKLVFPALEDRDWQVTTGSDHKNEAWSYHNGGAWPCLLWPLASAARHTGRADVAAAALARAAARLPEDRWPEYYEGRGSERVGRRARLRQTWSAAGLLAADVLLRTPDAPDPFLFHRDGELERRIGWVAQESEAGR